MKKPARAGKRILTLDDLVNAAYERRSVIDRSGCRNPAAAMVNMQGLTIARAIMDGIWIYKPEPAPIPHDAYYP